MDGESGEGVQEYVPVIWKADRVIRADGRRGETGQEKGIMHGQARAEAAEQVGLDPGSGTGLWILIWTRLEWAPHLGIRGKEIEDPEAGTASVERGTASDSSLVE